MELQPGDIIPINMPENAIMFVEDLPTFRVKMGRSGENLAVQVSEKIKRPDVVKTDIAFLSKDVISELEDDDGDIDD